MTGILSSSQSKKRKHRSTEDVDPGASQRKKEKRHKTTVPSVAPPLEDRLRHKPVSFKDKGKSRASEDLPSEFRNINASLVLSIPPVFASDLRAGVEEMLDSMVMRYIPSLQGVLLAHSNIRFLSQTASIRGDCPFAVCNVSFDATVWGPRVSMKLVGRINLCSPDHISLLVHRTFNVSIPRHHIPQDQWVFEYGPAPNDPEFGERMGWDAGGESKSAIGGEDDAEMDDSTGQKASQETREAESSGRWVHHLTGSKLGDPDGYVEFTFDRLTIANEMLSLQGSIQPDPYSPEHVPHPNKEPSSAFVGDETSDIEVHHEGDRTEEDEDESDEDTFRHLAKLSDEVHAAQMAKRAKEEAERVEKEKKRKRRESRSRGDGEGKRAEKKRIKETSS